MPLKIRVNLILLCSVLLLIVPNKFSYAYKQPDKSAIEVLEEILAKPASQIDLALTKLTIDKLVDPTINIDRALGEINYMAQSVNSAATPDMTAMDRMQSLRTYLYDSGFWNQNQPYKYDFADPLGTSIQNKLMPTYLKNRKGNCISMPFLFVILAEKLGLETTVATAPLHVFVKFKEPQTGKWLNLETTDIAQIVEDSFYREKSPMTDIAIKNGVYLQALSKKEAVTVMATVLSDHYAEQKQWQKVIDVSKLILKYYPKYAYAMLKLGNAYRGLLQAKIKQFSATKPITQIEKSYLDELYAQNKSWFEKAEVLGWQPVTQETNEEYMKSIKQRTAITTTQSKGK